MPSHITRSGFLFALGIGMLVIAGVYSGYCAGLTQGWQLDNSYGPGRDSMKFYGLSGLLHWLLLMPGVCLSLHRGIWWQISAFLAGFAAWYFLADSLGFGPSAFGRSLYYWFGLPLFAIGVVRVLLLRRDSESPNDDDDESDEEPFRPFTVIRWEALAEWLPASMVMCVVFSAVSVGVAGMRLPATTSVGPLPVVLAALFALMNSILVHSSAKHGLWRVWVLGVATLAGVAAGMWFLWLSWHKMRSPGVFSLNGAAENCVALLVGGWAVAAAFRSRRFAPSHRRHRRVGRCFHCGYSPAALSPGEACPECGEKKGVGDDPRRGRQGAE